MPSRQLAGYLLFPVLLLSAAWLIHDLMLWSYLGNFTVPWFCTALALAVLVLGVTCCVCQCSPPDLPRGRVLLVNAMVILILGIGMLIDFFAYDQSSDWPASFGEWIGFSVLLLGVFLLPRSRGATRP